MLGKRLADDVLDTAALAFGAGKSLDLLGHDLQRLGQDRVEHVVRVGQGLAGAGSAKLEAKGEVRLRSVVSRGK